MFEVEGYKLLHRIAVGGMSEIYKAVSTNPSDAGRSFAIKFILKELSEDEVFTQMFMDEARIAMQLKHPHIVEVVECGENQGRQFMVMEFIDGPNLKGLLHRSRKQKIRFPFEIASLICLDIADALHWAYHATDSKGRAFDVIHRDVSPQNILISRAGLAKLTDFGIAKTAVRLARTQIGQVRGKMFYMSPEQLAGAVLDHRSDQYALGIVLYELISGSPTLSMDPNIPLSPLASIRKDIPRDLERIIQTMIQPKPVDRFDSCNTVAQYLRTFLAEAVNELPREGVAKFVQQLYPENEEQSTGESFAFIPTTGRHNIRRTSYSRWVLASVAVGAFFFSYKFWMNKERPPLKSPPAQAKQENVEQKVAKLPSVIPTIVVIPTPSSCPQDMMEVQKGEFFFGSKENDPDRNEFSEARLERRVVDRFCIDFYEFPNAKGQIPKTEVTWKEAESLCAEKSKRLCHEWEWERACKGADSARYPYGNQWVAGICNDERTPVDSKSGSNVRPSGEFLSCKSSKALFDMSGNVEEWTSSFARFDSSSMVARGGASLLPRWASRCASVREYRKEIVRNTLGFRCCKDL